MQVSFDFVYVFDPLCSWCWGFSPVVQQLAHAYREQSRVLVFSGGMAIGDRAQPLGEGAAQLKESLKTIEETTEAEFGQPFLELLDEGTYVYDSEPPSIALKVFKSMKPAQQLEFAHRLQQALFREGRDLNDPSTYAELISPYELDVQEFMKRFRDPAYKDKTYKEFMFVQQLGAGGFPTLLMSFEDHLYLVARGYRSYDELEAIIEKVLTEERAAK